MRLSPAQIAVHWICGLSFPDDEGKSFAELVRNGHDYLVRIAGRDFGYDLQAWHDHLKESREGGYTYGRNIVLPRDMAAGRKSSDWQAAVESLHKALEAGAE